jgi:hypothetical protein
MLIADDHEIMRNGLHRLLATHRDNLMRELDLYSMSDLGRYAIGNRAVEP